MSIEIPDIKMTVPVPYERQYAKSSRSIEPSIESGIREMKWNVSLEYAAFLIEEGELDKDDYVIAVHESDLFTTIYNELEEDHGEDIAYKVVDTIIKAELESALQKNNTSWEDWV